MSNKSRTHEIPQPGQVWQHFRGTRYVVDHVGTDTESGSPQVAYYAESQDAEYRQSGPNAVDWWHRRLDSFLGSTKADDGGNAWRFTRVEDAKEK